MKFMNMRVTRLVYAMMTHGDGSLSN